MSDHFDFRTACDLRSDTPQQVVATLRYMTRADNYDFNDPPDHPFFERDESYGGEVYEQWRHILQCREGYTPGTFGSSLHRAYRGYRSDGQQIILWTLDAHCYVLDDELGDYLTFCAWLASYSETQGFVGYLRNESTDSLLLLYFQAGELNVHEVKVLI
jgi:hypothetical protein